MYTKITISGKICTGKSTLFNNLSQHLKWPTFHTGQFFREYAKKHHLLLEKAQEQSVKLTKKIDYKVRAMLKIKKGNLIVDSWMAGIMADSFPHVLRVLLVSEDTIRIKTYCPICGSEEIEPVEVSYAFKLLLEELQGLHINTSFELKNKYE